MILRYKWLFHLLNILLIVIFAAFVLIPLVTGTEVIILKEKVRNRKETFWNLINDMYGGMFSVKIALSQFPDINKGYFSYLIAHPLDHGIIIFISILCFGYGMLQGYKFKFQKKIEKIFMIKSGKHYYKKEGRVITIYLKDPVLYNEQQDGMLILAIYKDCLIEKEKKHIKGLYIPIKEIDELGNNRKYEKNIS